MTSKTDSQEQARRAIADLADGSDGAIRKLIVRVSDKVALTLHGEQLRDFGDRIKAVAEEFVPSQPQASTEKPQDPKPKNAAGAT